MLQSMGCPPRPAYGGLRTVCGLRTSGRAGRLVAAAQSVRAVRPRLAGEPVVGWQRAAAQWQAGVQVAQTMLMLALVPLVAPWCKVPSLDPQGAEAKLENDPQWRAKLRAVTVSLGQTPYPKPRLHETNQAWLARRKFDLAIGGGFISGVFRGLGYCEALQQCGLWGNVELMGGVSSGSLVGALLGSTSLEEAKEAALSFGMQDFFTPSWHTLLTQKALCPGTTLEQKLTDIFGEMRLEDLKPPLQVAIYNCDARRTELLSTGRIVDVVRASTSLPLIFVPKKLQIAGQNIVAIDGGWRDPHLLLAARPKKNRLTLRMDEGSAKPSLLGKCLDRPEPLQGIVQQAPHAMLYGHSDIHISLASFPYDLTFTQKGARLMEESKQIALQFLAAPRQTSSNFG